MQRLQAFKFELRPTGEQVRAMSRFAGSCRFVYNKALALQKENYETGNKFIGYVAMAKYLTAWRNSDQTPWLMDAPCHPLQQALKDLERSYKKPARAAALHRSPAGLTRSAVVLPERQFHDGLSHRVRAKGGRCSASSGPLISDHIHSKH